MENAVIQNIRRKITRGKFGDIFYISSFPKYDVEYVTKLLAQFEKEGLLTRVSKGVYVKPKKTRFGLLYPSTYELVTEIAKRDKAKIIPDGNSAANHLGFSTQVPTNPCYLTSGSSRKLNIGKRTVTLKHAAPRYFAFKGKLMPELVQALRSIGKDNISPEIENRISHLLLKAPETETIEHDLLIAPVWMRQLIKKNYNVSKSE